MPKQLSQAERNQAQGSLEQVLKEVVEPVIQKWKNDVPKSWEVSAHTVVANPPAINIRVNPVGSSPHSYNNLLNRLSLKLGLTLDPLGLTVDLRPETDTTGRVWAIVPKNRDYKAYLKFIESIESKEPASA